MKKNLFKKIVSLTAAASMMMSMAVMANAAEYTDATELKVGDYVQMGKYNSEPLKWRVVEYGGNTMLFLDNALCMKAYDAPGTNGSHAKDTTENRNTHGSPVWSDSNIRSWLNSDASGDNIVWLCDNAPNDPTYGYGTGDGTTVTNWENGFLHNDNFTNDEKSLIKATEQKSLVHTIDSNTGTADYMIDNITYPVAWGTLCNDERYNAAPYEVTTDKMFLLDMKQAQAVVNAFGADYITKVKSFTRLRDSVRRYNNYYCQSAILWSNSSESTMALWMDEVKKNASHVIRPAFYLNVDNAVLATGNGTEESPYTLEVKAPKFTAETVNVGGYTGETEGDIATGFLATVTNNGTGAGSFSSMDITVKPSEGNGDAMTFEKQTATATLAAGAKAYFGIIVKNLNDGIATAGVTVNQ